MGDGLTKFDIIRVDLTKVDLVCAPRSYTYIRTTKIKRVGGLTVEKLTTDSNSNFDIDDA